MKMDDIARLANVSKSAVSIALNNRSGVSEETRDRILKIVKEQNYSPQHRVRKAPAKSILHFVTVSEKGQEHQTTKLPFFASLIAEFSLITQRMKIGLQLENVTISQIGTWAASLDEEGPEYFGTIILATSLSKEQILQFTSKLKRVLILDASYKSLAANTVAIDNFLGGYRAADTLLKRHYNDIGYIQAQEFYPNYIDRQRGFKSRLNEAHIDLKSIFKVSSMTMQDPGDNVVFESSLPRVLFCDNDYIAIRIMRLAQQRGIKIPEDLAIMGFDDIGEGRVTSPELATVHVPVNTIAKLAVSRLQDLKDDRLNMYRIKQLVEPRIIVRQSI